MSTFNQYAPRGFFKVGMQYYIAGRAAALSQLVPPVAGNLFHHAVEMLLKGELLKTLPLDDHIKKRFGHHLIKTWNAFKALSGQDLSVDASDLQYLDDDAVWERRASGRLDSEPVLSIIRSHPVTLKTLDPKDLDVMGTFNHQCETPLRSQLLSGIA